MTYETPVSDPETSGSSSDPICYNVPEEGLLGLGLERFEEEKVIEFGFNFEPDLDPHSIVFDSETGALTVKTSVDMIIVSDAVSGLSPWGIEVEINLQLDENGDFVGGSGFDLFIYDDQNQDGVIEDHEVLLQGEAVAFGHETETGWETDTFEFLFDIDGGILADEFDDLMAFEIGMMFSDWDGGFESDFSGYAKGIAGNSGIDEICDDTPPPIDDTPPPPVDDLPPPPIDDLPPPPLDVPFV